MSTITLISPYFGERFPNTFPILFDRKLQEQVSHPMARHREMNCYL